MKLAAAYVTVLVAFAALDFLWLGLVASGLYREQMGSLLADQINLAAAAAFYLLFAAGLVFFAVSPALADGGVVRAMLLGAALGVIAYGTYDLTGLAVIRGFPLKLAFIDMAWGALLSAVAAGAGTWVAAKF